MNTITIGVYLGKNPFSACEVNGSGCVLQQQDLHRGAFRV